MRYDSAPVYVTEHMPVLACFSCKVLDISRDSTIKVRCLWSFVADSFKLRNAISSAIGLLDPTLRVERPASVSVGLMDVEHP